MSNVSFIEALDQALHLLEQGYSLEKCLAHFPEYADELRPLLMVSDDLRRLAHTALPSDGTSESPQPDWHRLLHGVPQQQPSTTSRLWRSVRHSVRNAGFALFGAQTAFAVRYATAGILSIALAVGLWNGADNSVPGSPLHPVKTAVEQFQILAALSDEERGKVHLEIALRRAVELETLIRNDLHVPERLLRETVDAAQRAVAAVEAGGDLEKTAETLGKLEQVNTKLADAFAYASLELQPEIARASKSVAQLETQLGGASNGIADASPTTVASALPSPTGAATGLTTATSEPTTTTPAPSHTLTPTPDVPTATIPAPVLAATQAPPVQPPATITPVPTVVVVEPSNTPVSGVGTAPTPSNTPEPTPTNTPVPSPSPTNTPEPTPTNTPVPSPSPTDTPTPADQSTTTPTTHAPMSPTEGSTVEPTGTAEPTASPTAHPTVDPTTNASQTATTEPPTVTPETPETTATPIPPVSPEQQMEQTTAVESDPSSSVPSREPTMPWTTALLERRPALLMLMPSSQPTATEQPEQSDDESIPALDEPTLNS